jgi:hypothetical protein
MIGQADGALAAKSAAAWGCALSHYEKTTITMLYLRAILTDVNWGIHPIWSSDGALSRAGEIVRRIGVAMRFGISAAYA